MERLNAKNLSNFTSNFVEGFNISWHKFHSISTDEGEQKEARFNKMLEKPSYYQQSKLWRYLMKFCK
jgi:hypothetical protein